MIPKIKTRITFDYDGDRRGSYEKLKQIICASRWGSGIDIFGIMNGTHPLIFDLMMKGVIIIDECEYEATESCAESENARLMKTMLGKRSNHSVLREMAALFSNEPFEMSEYYRNTVYFPKLKAFA